MLYGYNFDLFSKQHYINAEASYAKLFDYDNDLGQILHLDLALGVSVTKKNTAIFQSLNWYDPESKRYCNMGQVSWLYKYNDTISWETGYSTNLSRRNEVITESFITGIWLKF